MSNFSAKILAANRSLSFPSLSSFSILLPTCTVLIVLLLSTFPIVSFSTLEAMISRTSTNALKRIHPNLGVSYIEISNYIRKPYLSPITKKKSFCPHRTTSTFHRKFIHNQEHPDQDRPEASSSLAVLAKYKASCECQLGTAVAGAESLTRL
jgi:hypothetical protein